ncbi:hypothetical protein ACFC1L_44165 [Streptomyces sp. NPDC056210]|uniref:hypothetical protein n=1 Tax=Streptomyces sp. NPDC056210 TaxID=3345746 RepID=UPI0035D9997F
MRIADTDPLWVYAVKHEVAEIFKAALKQYRAPQQQHGTHRQTQPRSTTGAPQSSGTMAGTSALPRLATTSSTASDPCRPPSTPG